MGMTTHDTPAGPTPILGKRLDNLTDELRGHVKGSHRLLSNGYCPDCNGSCLVGFGNPTHDTPEAAWKPPSKEADRFWEGRTAGLESDARCPKCGEFEDECACSSPTTRDTPEAEERLPADAVPDAERLLSAHNDLVSRVNFLLDGDAGPTRKAVVRYIDDMFAALAPQAKP
jgi:hypothetical protein